MLFILEIKKTDTAGYTGSIGSAIIKGLFHPVDQRENRRKESTRSFKFQPAIRGHRI